MFRLKEVSDVFVDAAICDSNNVLLFISLYGRDTSLNQLFAGFSISATTGGYDRLTIIGDEKSYRFDIGDAHRFDRFDGRLPKDNLFGNLSHVWIFDQRLISIDQSNKIAYALSLASQNGAQSDQDEQTWILVKSLSSLPLLEHWKTPIFRHFGDQLIQGMTCVGDIGAIKVQLPDDFNEVISELVQSGVLRLDDVEVGFDNILRLGSLIAA